jgi:hypothetical protein
VIRLVWCSNLPSSRRLLTGLWRTGLVIRPPVNQGSPRPKLLHSIAEERGQLYARSSLEVSMTGNPFEGIDEVVIDDEGNLHPVRE